jgi:hypothetical protein
MVIISIGMVFFTITAVIIALDEKNVNDMAKNADRTMKIYLATSGPRASWARKPIKLFTPPVGLTLSYNGVIIRT